MSKVETLRGAIETSELGFTLMHEHIFAHPEGLVENFPSIWNKEEQVAKAREKLREIAKVGVQTLVDQTILGLGRNIPLILQVAGDLPLNVIVATGVYYTFDLSLNYLQPAPIKVIVDLFVRDIKVGIQGTKVKAGLVKASSDHPGLTPGIEKLFRAAAQAHRQTGVPLYTHSESKTQQGLKQQDLFEQEGVDLTRVVIGHAGDSVDIDYLKRLVDRGSFIGMDRICLDTLGDLPPFAKRVEVVAKMCRIGYAGQMVLSHDAFSYFTIVPWEVFTARAPTIGFRTVSQQFIPALMEAGVSQDQIRQMTVENPRRLFENSNPY